jgi:hypothetical protein
LKLVNTAAEVNGLMSICQQFREKKYGGEFRVNQPDNQNAKMEASGQHRDFCFSGSSPATTHRAFRASGKQT